MKLRLSRPKWRARDLVDVIIPTYNRREMLLTRALPSVLAQTHRKFRIIIVCHGCTDGTAMAAASFFRRNAIVDGADCAVERGIYDFPRIKVVTVARMRSYPPTAENHWLAGPVDPLNAGLNRVRGDWIARIDDDDVWSPRHLETMLAFAEAGKYEFVSSAHETPAGKVAPYNLGDGTLVGGCQTWLYREYLRFFRYNPDCWRKSWNRNNDTDLQDRMWRAGVRMGYLDKVTCKILPRPGETRIGLAAYLENRDSVARAYAFSK